LKQGIQFWGGTILGLVAARYGTFHSSLLACSSYSLTIASFKVIALLHDLLPFSSISSVTILSGHPQHNQAILNLVFLVVFFLLGFLETLFTILLHSILTTWPAHSNRLTITVVTLSALLY
jgi:hypothetical protein